MAPLLAHGDRILVFRWYSIRRLRQGQVVALTLTPEHPTTDLERNPWYVKRIVATGGETFTLDTAPYPAADAHVSGAQVDDTGRWTWRIPPGHVFVCGDQRESSIDSRVWGPVPVNQIIGIMLWKLPGAPFAPSELSSSDRVSYEPLSDGHDY